MVYFPEEARNEKPHGQPLSGQGPHMQPGRALAVYGGV